MNYYEKSNRLIATEMELSDAAVLSAEEYEAKLKAALEWAKEHPQPVNDEVSPEDIFEALEGIL